MAAEIVLAPEAEIDIDEAYAWYEKQRTGLGEEFLSCVDASIQGIARNPDLHPKIHLEYRRALIRRFPYLVFYESAGDSVTIYSVFHMSRNPEKWRERLP